MKADIQRLLAERDIDILWVIGASHECPETYYLTNGQPFTQAWVLVTRGGREPLLVHGAMERESAVASGCRSMDFSSLGMEDLARRIPDPLALRLEVFARLAEKERLQGRLAVHGVMDPGEAYAMLAAIPGKVTGLSIVRDTPSLISEARITKDERELAELKRVAHEALGALEAGLALLRSGHLEQGRLLDKKGKGITVGRVKAAISGELAVRGLHETHDTILSTGREAGIPHASSAPDTVFTESRTVVLDLFPCPKGGGYYFDITRSFGIGSLTGEARQLYDTVLEAQEKALEAVEPGLDGSCLQDLVCELFEARGHPTIRGNPQTTEGYVHSLGHGVGLEVHEFPYLRLTEKSNPRNRLLPGTVFTIEPGLYYPERGMGIRIEDIVYIDQGGRTQVLAPFPKFHVLEPQG